MMVLTGGFFFVEIIVGYVTNSMALVADSFHMLGDIAALVISFLSVKVRVNDVYHKRAIKQKDYFSDVPEKMVQKHIRMGPRRSAGSIGQRRLFSCAVFQYYNRSLQTVSTFWLLVHLSKRCNRQQLFKKS